MVIVHANIFLFLVQTSRGLGIEVRDSSSDGRPGIFVKALTPKGAAALVSSLRERLWDDHRSLIPVPMGTTVC